MTYQCARLICTLSQIAALETDIEILGKHAFQSCGLRVLNTCTVCSGGRPYKKLRGLGMQYDTAIERCNMAYQTLQKSFPAGEQLPYLDFKKFCMDVLDAETRKLGKSELLI